MSDDLRGRIAAVLAQHSWLPGRADCYCGSNIAWADHPRHQADAVITVLQDGYVLVPKSKTLAADIAARFP